jgi:hypothetical protein
MAILPKKNLYVQCNPHKNSNDILHKDRKINPKIHMKAPKTMNGHGNTEQEEQHWRFQNI